ncbi:MAG: hypothetical protein H8E11_03715 [Candidatus Cloacimonetes bacterium]|nr:hypothetical protein [Candidatus Cloacimonadota bacterium]
MQNVAIYHSDQSARKELCEFFYNKGYSPYFAQTQSELLSLLDSKELSKTFMYVRNLSDLRFLQLVRSSFAEVEINLIIPPSLREIIELLQNSDFKILNEVTQIV